jgi:hypothetical protein
MKIGYKALKHVTVLLSTLSVPFGVYAGAMLALGRPLYFFLGLALSMLFTFTQSQIWWLTMEKLPTDRTSVQSDKREASQVKLN